MPNQPKTPVRSVRVPQPLWDAAKTCADSNDETVTDVIVRALNEYVIPAPPATASRSRSVRQE